jgi:hypothetical protein
MSARTRRTAAARQTGIETSAPWDFLADLGRQQMSVANDASCAMFRGFEAIRKIQEEAAHHASVRHEAAAQKLHGSCQPTELIAIQAGLLREDIESATQYWQQLAATAMEMQTQMMGCTSHLLDSDTALESVHALDMLPGVSSWFPFCPVAEQRNRHA